MQSQVTGRSPPVSGSMKKTTYQVVSGNKMKFSYLGVSGNREKSTYLPVSGNIGESSYLAALVKKKIWLLAVSGNPLDHFIFCFCFGGFLFFFKTGKWFALALK